MTVRIAHEAPISIFKHVQSLTDYDYALVHLFEENEAYYKLFVDALAEGREVILDNSIFELGAAFDIERYAYWIEKLKPTYYIIPDVLESSDGTISNFIGWMNTYDHLPGKTIGVVQGADYEEVVECYRFMVDKVDKIAISFDYSFFNTWAEESGVQHATKYHEWMVGRQNLLDKMLNDGVIDTNKPHHLLGCGVPQEFSEYRKYNFIDSIDTSNPVVSGIVGDRYNSTHGLDNKSSIKLFRLINLKCTTEQRELINYNIDCFRRIVNG